MNHVRPVAEPEQSIIPALMWQLEHVLRAMVAEETNYNTEKENIYENTGS